MQVERAKQIFADRGGTLRTSEALEAGIHPRTLYAMRDSGDLQVLARGVYRLSNMGRMKSPDLATIAKRVPKGVICLRSALAHHGLGGKPSDGVDIALPRTAGTPSMSNPALNVYRFSDNAFCAGIEAHHVDGVPLRVYSLEKTIADCLKFRTQIGSRTAFGALDRSLATDCVRPDQLRYFARLCRVERLVEPYVRDLTVSAGVNHNSSRKDKTTNMLKRQRILLGLLHRAGGALGRTQLVMMAFLLGKETDVRSREAYYDFVPYKYGPFSFSLYRELGALERDEYVQLGEDRIQLCEGIRDRVAALLDDMAAPIRRAIDQVVAHYGSLTQHALLSKVYRKYPWYAMASERHDLVPDSAPSRTDADIAVYTVGYEGKSVDAFFDGLIRTGIRAVLDVRANPVSRKYGFAKRSMNEIASKVGIHYIHLPELGISSSLRTDLSDFNSYQNLLDRYEHEILPDRTEDLCRLVDLIRERPSALLCVEKDVRCCHRSRLAEAASNASGLPVVHL